MEGKTGFVFRPEDPVDLAATIEQYFASDLFANLKARRQGNTRLRERAAFLGCRRPVDDGAFTETCFNNPLRSSCRIVDGMRSASLDMKNPS